MRTIIMYVVGGIVALAVVVGVSVLTVKLVGGGEASVGAVGAPAAHVEITEKNTVKLTEFVTNLADQRQYIKVTMQLVLTKDKDLERVNAAVPRIRDQIVQVLNTKKSLEVTGSEGANKLKADVLKLLNEQLGANTIHEVLITDIVVQY
ncbi:MAG TPA: flagellar basal body-associated FliL family protein [Symbiobacteriaceae bacterium]|nr:flagellar basal body-associated FliL family protein [Symbiobacteriaceae bacterium]